MSREPGHNTSVAEGINKRRIEHREASAQGKTTAALASKNVSSTCCGCCQSKPARSGGKTTSALTKSVEFAQCQAGWSQLGSFWLVFFW